MSDDATCNRCHYWEPLDVVGLCRRYAPAPRPSLIAATESPNVAGCLWPSTLPTDACGEFRASETSAPAQHRCGTCGLKHRQPTCPQCGLPAA